MRIRMYVNTMTCVGEEFDKHNSYLTGKDYVEVLHEESDITKDIVVAGMVGYGENNKFRRADMSLFRQSKMPSDFKVMDEKNEYYHCDAIVYGEDGTEMDVDGLVELYAKNDAFMVYIGFPEDGDDDDYEFLSLMKEWYYKYKHLEASTVLTDLEKMKKTGSMDFGIEFTNKAGVKVNGRMDGCKMFGMDDQGRLCLVVANFELYY